MRPDEHKKKKSAQYKQKHGVPKDTKDGKGASFKNDRTKGKPLREKQTREGASSSMVNPSTSTDTNKQVSSDSSEEDIPTQGVVFHKKTFSKRKIVSNWDRYEIPHVDENQPEERKGSDFSTLLNLTGSSLSQFRFKSEKNLDKEISDISTSQYSNIDLQDLSTCIDTIPLYKQLALDQHLFTEEQIEDMNIESERKSKEYISQVPELPAVKTKPLPMNSTNIGDRDFELEHLSANIENNLTISDPTDSAIQLSKSVIPKPNDPISEQECELEQLLSMGNSTNTNIQKTNTVSNGSILKSSPNLKSNPSNEIRSVSEKEQSAVPGMEDLEDWLDSVLDT